MIRGDPPTVTGRRDGDRVAVECPFCEGEHTHSITEDMTGQGGHRVPECGEGLQYTIFLEGSE